jgi:hypothetical protein
MRPELERLQRIEAQLLGPAPTAADWPLQLLLDPTLAADAEVQQQLYQGLRQAGRRQLRAELNAIHAQLYAPRQSWTSTAVAGLRTVLTRWVRFRPDR